MIDDLFNYRMDYLSVTHTRDAAGGQVPSYAIKHSYVACRHEEAQSLTYGVPAELGGAPTMVHEHRFFHRDIGEILTSDIAVDETGTMLRIADSSVRREIRNAPRFRVTTSRETLAGTGSTLILLDQNSDPVRDQNNELVLVP